MFSKNKYRYELYWIHRNIHENIFKEGYIGISINYKKRFVKHKWDAKNKELNYPLHHALLKYEDILCDLLCVGSLNYILDLEYRLRPTERTGWNLGVGGEKPTIGFKHTEEQNIENASRSTKVSRLNVLNIWVDHFEKGFSHQEIADKYNLCRSTVSRYCRGDTLIFNDLEDTRIVLKKNMILRSSGKRSISETFYNKILERREVGYTYSSIANEFGMSDRAVRSLCKGEYEYIRKYKSYRIVD